MTCMKRLSFLAMVVLSAISMAIPASAKKNDDDNKVHLFVENLPQYPGGISAMGDKPLWQGNGQHVSACVKHVNTTARMLSVFQTP